MELQSLLILLLALLITVIASWSLSTFIRLHKAATQYDSDSTLSEKCNLTKNYILVGRTVAIVLVVVSVIVMIASSIWLIRSLQS